MAPRPSRHRRIHRCDETPQCPSRQSNPGWFRRSLHPAPRPRIPARRYSKDFVGSAVRTAFVFVVRTADPTEGDSMPRPISKVAPDWCDYTTLDPQLLEDAAHLTEKDLLKLSRPGFKIVFYETLE